MKTTVAALAAIALGGVIELRAEPVTWSGAVGVTVAGNSLTRGAAAPAWNAGAASVQVIRDGYGFVEFTATETNTERMCGLSRGDSDQGYADIDFSLYPAANGTTQVYEGGSYRGQFGAYASGDRLRVEVSSGAVRYFRNGTLLYTSALAPSFPLRVDCSLYTPGATLTDVRVGNLVWSGVTALSIADRTLTATGAAGWNSGAASANLIGGGDGYVEFTAGQNTTSRAAGLANGNAAPTLADIEYAIHLRADGVASVVEAGVSRGDFGGYVGSDRFRVEVSGGAVKYLKNGGLFYTSAVAPAYPLRADTAFETTGALLQDLLVESLVWTSEVGVNVSGATLAKTAGSGWNAGAASANVIASGDGWVEFTAIETHTQRVLGLEAGPASATWSDIDFAIELTDTGSVKVHESGQLRGTFGTYAHTDRFRIEIREGVVRYRKNGTVLYTSAVAPTYPLHADASLYTTGATLVDVAVGDVVWLNEQGVEVRGTLLRKSDPTSSWDTAGLASTRAIDDGYVEFVAGVNAHARMLALSHGDTSVNYADLDYALYPNDVQYLHVFEKGINRGHFGTYVAGDRLRIRVQSGVVTYWKNDALIYTSTVAPTLPLRVDGSFWNPGSTLFDVWLKGAAATDELEPPVVSPSTGTYGAAQNVTMTAFLGAAIRYTTDGSTPSETSPLYAGPVPVSTQTTLKARAFKPGYTPSATAVATYTFNYGTLAAPTLTPGGTYITSVDVSMSAGAGTTIRYTTDGTSVTESSPLYSTPVTIDATKTVSARAFKVDWTASAAATVTYTIKVATPVISLAGGTHAAGAPITVTLPTPGATANYTTNGVDPANPAANEVSIVSGGSLFAGNYTLKVRSYKAGLTASDVATATYTATGSLSSGDIVSGGDHSLAALPDGQLWGWGAGGYAQPGSGVGIAGGYPQPIVGIGLTGIVKVAGGEAFSLALRTDGRFYVFGHGIDGQLGLGDANTRYTPTLHPLTNVTAISAGERHSLALRSDGTVWAWGVNTYGQLGFGPAPAPLPATTVVSTPGQVEGLQGVTIVAITAGDNHSVALDSQGRVWTWGLNTRYQLGDGTTTQRNRPVRVDGLWGIVAIASGTGSNHTLAIRGGDRAVFAWGSNDYGTLGDGTHVPRASPVKVIGLTGIAAVGTSAFISTAVGQDGRLWSWGAAGQVGDGSTTGGANLVVPVELQPTGIIRTSPGNGASSGHALALSNDGVIWSWGYGASHQIGDGNLSGNWMRYRPVRVTEPGFAPKVATPYPTGANPGQHYQPVTIGFASYTAAAAIHYTTDGTEPTTGSPLYSAPFQVAQNTTFKVKAFKSGLAASNTETLAYTIPAATPTFTPGSGTYTTPQNVTISSSPGAAIRYTTDGTVPTAASTLYTAPLPVNGNTSFQAKAFHGSMGESAAGYANYSFNFPTGGTPVFAPGAGTYVGSVAVTISGPAGATLRYTTDGSEPTSTSAAYSSPLTLTATTTLKAKSYQTGQSPSATTTGAYTIELTLPTFSPPGGTITAGQPVTLNHADPGVTIRYTINGVDPGPSDAMAAPGSSVTLLANVTLKARAYKTGNAPSAVTSGTFTISGTAGAAGAIAAGNTHALVAKPDGTVWTWGANTSGPLGDGTNVNRHSPTLISNLSGITGVSGGANHSAVRKSDGTPWTTGYNASGQLGDGTNNTRYTFAALAKPGGVDVIAVAAGWDHTLALGADGRVWAWGYNYAGQLGTGNYTSQNAPILVSGLSNVQGIAASRFHSLAVTASGAVWAWGAGDEGQLGHGATTGSNVPVQVTTVAATNLTGVVGVAAGSNFSLARKADGTVWSWGRNAEGQLGSGSISTLRTRADQVVPLAQVRNIAAGDWHALAVREDGSVWGWGYGAYGQLGNESGANQPTPVQAVNISGIDSVAAGGYFSLALGLDGSVWSWGSNSFGQLGDGTTTSRATPGRVAEPGFAWRVALPVFSPAGAALGAPQNITLTCTTPGAAIHYTTSGADPTPADPSVASGGVVWVDVSTTLKARAYKTDWTPSAVNAVGYTMTLPPVTFSPGTGTYHVPVSVSLTHSVPGAVIRYTTNGSPVTAASPIHPLGGTIAVNESQTVLAALFRSSTMGGGGGTAFGPTAQHAYTMKVARPLHVFGGAGPGGAGTGLVGASTETPDARIWGARGAALLGSSTQSVASGGLFAIDGSTTLRTRGKHAGLWLPSDPQSTSHFLSRGNAATPGFALGPSTAWGRYLRISSATSGATLRYTLDGSEPTFFSRPYRGPVRVSPGMVFRARAFGRDYVASAPTSAFPIGSGDLPDATEPPTFDPPGGTYTTTRVVTLASATSGATIHYTTDGAEPTTASPSVASGGTVTVTRGLPLKALAIAGGMSQSRVARADYRITGAVVAGIHDAYNNVQSALALKTDGTVWGWGNNAYGELGIGVGGVQNSPVPVAGLGTAKAIALGISHGLAVKPDGTVWSWGQNHYGQLGDGTTTAHLTPAVVPGLSQVVSVAAGAGTSYALTSNGWVYSWGINTYGQLGHLGSNPTSPHLVSLSEVIAIAAGSNHVLALRKDGTAWAWGYNFHGQVGDGTATHRPWPVQVHGLTGVTAIAAAGHQSFAVKSDGRWNGQAWAWGYNQNNTLGDTLAIDQPIPVHVLDDVRAIFAGDSLSTFYVKADATGRSSLWGAGNHNSGFLHPASANVTSHPTPVSPGSFVSVAPGAGFRTALRTDTTLLNWGNWPAANGFALGDVAWANSDHDGDGLRTALEWDIGTDPWNADSNGDGIPDASSVASGADPLATDVDGDGLASALERSMGTDAFRADTDGDGHPDGADAYPLDPTRWEGPPPNGGDTTAPLVTLTEPSSATLVSVVPAP